MEKNRIYDKLFLGWCCVQQSLIQKIKLNVKWCLTLNTAFFLSRYSIYVCNGIYTLLGGMCNGDITMTSN